MQAEISKIRPYISKRKLEALAALASEKPSKVAKTDIAVTGQVLPNTFQCGTLNVVMPGPVKKAIDDRHTGKRYKVGDPVQYWSKGMNTWLDDRITAVHTDKNGELKYYEITGKSKAEPSKLRPRPATKGKAHSAKATDVLKSRLSQFAKKSHHRAAKPSVTVAPSNKAPESIAVKSSKAAPSGSLATYKVDQNVRYYSDSAKRWVRAVVKAVKHKQGAWIYDLNCKPDVKETQIRPADDAAKGKIAASTSHADISVEVLHQKATKMEQRRGKWKAFSASASPSKSDVTSQNALSTPNSDARLQAKTAPNNKADVIKKTNGDADTNTGDKLKTQQDNR